MKGWPEQTSIQARARIGESRRGMTVRIYMKAPNRAAHREPLEGCTVSFRLSCRPGGRER